MFKLCYYHRFHYFLQRSEYYSESYNFNRLNRNVYDCSYYFNEDDFKYQKFDKFLIFLISRSATIKIIKFIKKLYLIIIIFVLIFGFKFSFSDFINEFRFTSFILLSKVYFEF